MGVIKVLSNTYIKSLLFALSFSLFIYLAYFDIKFPLLDTILAFVAIYGFLTLNKKEMFLFGFFVGIFWFYWVSISFIDHDIWYLIPAGVLFFGVVYGSIFWFVSLLKFPLLRGVALLFLSYIEPFAFNWFIPELMFINSYISTTKISFALSIFATLIFIYTKGIFRLAPFALVLFMALFLHKEPLFTLPELKIKIQTTDYKHKYKWDKSNFNTIISNNLKAIDMAYKDGYDLILFPETAFPLFLNRDKELLKILKQKSQNIAIITGALSYKDKNSYNSAYFFHKGEMSIGDKVVLAPFGEKIPLPKIFVDLINDIFYNGAKDYSPAQNVSDFKVGDVSFRSAVCYEATSHKLFENSPKYMVAISNNSIFTPSTEPTLQKMLLQYYSNRYSSTIFHSINGAKSYIVTPKKKGFFE